MGFCLDPAGCNPDTVEIVGHGGSIPGSRTLVAQHLHSGSVIAVHANIDEILLTELGALATEVLVELGVA